MPQPLKYLIIVLSVAVIIALVVGILVNEYVRPANPGDGDFTAFTPGSGDNPIDITIPQIETTDKQTDPNNTEQTTTETQFVESDKLTTEVDSQFITSDELTSDDTIEQIAEKYDIDVLDIIYLARTIAGEGGTGNMERAAVAWCVLNRVDSSLYPGTIQAVVTVPNQFNLSYTIYDGDIKLAEDVLERWYREKNGETNVGRVLPSQYCYFRGFKWADRANELGMSRPTKNHNWFFTRAEYNKGKYERNYWDWSLPNPYN